MLVTVEAHDDDFGDAFKNVDVGEYAVDKVNFIVPLAFEIRIVILWEVTSGQQGRIDQYTEGNEVLKPRMDHELSQAFSEKVVLK